MMTETERKAAFRANRMIEGFLSCALEDLQNNENEAAFYNGRPSPDVGTIYTVPDCTFLYAKRECEEFAAAAPVDLSDCSSEQIGSDLHLERAGHGAGFQDRTHDVDRDESASIGRALSAAVSPRGTCEIYLGDDGQPYFVGGER